MVSRTLYVNIGKIIILRSDVTLVIPYIVKQIQLNIREKFDIPCIHNFVKYQWDDYNLEAQEPSV